MNQIDIVIIEDDYRIAKELKTMIEGIQDNVRVIQTLYSVQESIAFFQTTQSKIDLILSDIMLGDGLSFDIFRNCNVTAPVIFCTTYDEFALEAFKNNGVDYILKPIEPENLKASLQKLQRLSVLNSEKINESLDKIESAIVSAEKQYVKSILCYFRDQVVPVAVDEVCFAHIEKGNTYLSSQQRQYRVQGAIESLFEKLNPEVFYRVNRQYIVNRNFIKSVSKMFGRKLLVQLHCQFDYQIIVSKANAPLFIHWLKSS
ncbi:MAG: LytTR family DNA-binding domain-containing protein [Bacteroidia bacterium]|nr:LytTR family DNA-binding domain-containing protein [Bacteroidia bacterium]